MQEAGQSFDLVHGQRPVTAHINRQRLRGYAKFFGKPASFEAAFLNHFFKCHGVRIVICEFQGKLFIARGALFCVAHTGRCPYACALHFGKTMTKAPSAFAIEAALSALKNARDQIANDDLDMDELELSAALAETSDQVDDILARLLRAAEFCGSMAEEANQRATMIKEREARFDRRAAVLRQQVLDLMQTLGRKRFAAGDIGCRIAPGIASVRVTDQTLLDKKYFNEPPLPTVSKRALREDLVQGVVVDGAVLSNPSHFLVIERK